MDFESWSSSPRSRECGYILLEDLEKASDEDHAEPTLRSLESNFDSLRPRDAGDRFLPKKQ